MENVFTFQININLSASHLRPDDPQRVREEGGGLRGHVRAPGPGRGVARHRLRLRVTLYAPSPTISLCRHAEQGCGVEAKKSPVAAKKPAYKRAAIVDETRDKSTGGDYGTRRWRRFPSRSGPRARPWPWWTLHNAQHSSQILLLTLPFFTSTTAGTRPGSRVTATTTSSAASPALVRGHQDNYCNSYLFM